MKKTSFLLLSLLLSSLIGARGQSLIAGWDFQTTNGGGTAVLASPNTPTLFNANFGSGTLYLNGSQGSSTWGTTELSAFAGASVNASNGLTAVTTSPAALALVYQGTNSKSAVFKFSLTGYQNLGLTYASQRTSTGFATQLWEWSTDGLTYNTIGSVLAGTNAGTLASAFTTSGVLGFSGISGLNNAASAYIRLTLSGATATSGNNRIDNIQFVASTYVPPSSELAWYGDGVSAGGAGTWSVSGNNWSSNGGTNVGTWTSTSKAVFAGTGGAVTVASGGITANNGIDFNASGYTVSGDALSFGASNNQITVTNGATATIASSISGTNGITKMGSGNLIVSGSNSFSGAVGVAAGTLQISADSALGDAANDLAVSSTLKTTASISLGASRDVSGNATLDIAPGTTLAVNGSMGTTATTLANTGTLQLAGATRNVGGLTFNAGALVDGMSGPVTASSVTATGVTNGAGASISGGLAFSSAGDKTVSVGTGGSLSISGPVSGTTGRIAKTGAGTLVLSGTNTTSGFRLGAAGAAPTDGGVVVLGSGASAGTNTLQFNYGTLQASTAISSDVGFSIGGRTGAVAVLGGTNSMIFGGTNSFYRAPGTTGELRLNVNNSTALNGNWVATSGGGTATGITLGGSGRLSLNGNASALTETVNVSENLTLAVNGALGGAVNVASTATLAGSGTIAGAAVIAGTHAPGNSPGIQTFASDLSYSGGASTVWELAANAQGTRGTTYDGIDVGGALAFNGPVTLSLQFNPSGSTVDWTDGFWASDHLGVAGWLVYSGATSLAGFDNLALSDRSTWLDTLSVALPGPATFFLEQQGNNVYLSYSSVPEPSTYALLAVAGTGLAGYVLRRRRR